MINDDVLNMINDDYYIIIRGHPLKEDPRTSMDASRTSMENAYINIIKWHADFYGDATLHTYVKTLQQWKRNQENRSVKKKKTMKAEAAAIEKAAKAAKAAAKVADAEKFDKDAKEFKDA